MAEPSNMGPYRAEGSFKIPYLREGLRSSLLPMDDDLLRLIGLVTAHWGHFEFRFNVAIEALLEAVGIQEDGWQGLSFPKRVTRFRRANTALNDDDANTAAAFERVAVEALELHWQRNVIVHGAYGITLAPNSDHATFYADGHRRKKPVRLPLNHAFLEQLWHDIAHLGGALYDAISLVGRVEGFWPTLPDTEILRVYRESHHPWNPNPDKRTPPPQS